MLEWDWDSGRKMLWGNLKKFLTTLLYDAVLNLDVKGKLSLASTNSSKWTTSGTNIFNNNIGNVGIGSQFPAYTLDVSEDTNAIRYLQNGNNISNFLPS